MSDFSAWTKQKKITILASNVADNKTNSTFIFKFIDGDVASFAKADGSDFRLLKSDKQTEVPLCIMRWDNVTGEFIASAKSERSSSADIDYYLIFGNQNAIKPSPDSDYGSQNAWDSTFDAAYYASNSDGTNVIDATANAFDMIFQGVNNYTYEFSQKINVPNGTHQGIFYDGSEYFYFDTTSISKSTTLDGSLTAQNTNILTEINNYLGVTADHGGAGYVSGEYLYIVANDFYAGVPYNVHVIARFNKSDLTFSDAWSISNAGGISGCCVDQTAGTNGIIYVCDYDIYTDKVKMYDLVDPTIYLGEITLSQDFVGTQGIDIDQTYNEFILSNYQDIAWYDRNGSFVEIRNNVSDGGIGKGENCYWYNNNVYHYDYNETVLYEYIPRQPEQSNIGESVLIGDKNQTYYLEAEYTLPETGSLQYVIKPREYYNYNAVFENSAGGNFWEGWLYSDGRLRNRIYTDTTQYDLDNIHAVESQNYIYNCFYSWTKDGTSHTSSLGVDGVVRASGAGTWTSPSNFFRWNGGPLNAPGRSAFFFMAFRNIDLGQDNALVTTENNFISDPENFIASGVVENFEPIKGFSVGVSWKVFSEQSKTTSYKIKNEHNTDIKYKVLNEKTKDTAFKVLNESSKDFEYKILTEYQKDIAWQILTSGVLSLDISWKILNESEKDISAKIFNESNKDVSWKILGISETSINLAWKILNEVEQIVEWKIQKEISADLAWKILNELSLDTSYKIFEVKSADLAYKIFAEIEKDTSWKIISDIIPKTIDFTAKERIFAFNAKTKTLIFFQKERN